jgi:hypothetical protein
VVDAMCAETKKPAGRGGLKAVSMALNLTRADLSQWER